MDPEKSSIAGKDIVPGTIVRDTALRKERVPKDKGAKNDEHVPEGASPIPGLSEWTENIFAEGDWRVSANAWAGFLLRILLISGTLFSVYQYLMARQEMRVERTLQLVELWERSEYQEAQKSLKTRLAGLNENGEVIVYWWAPDHIIRLGSNNWLMNNMTSQFSGPKFFGQLDAYVTPWGGLNIAGRTSGGDLYTYWWVPGFSVWVVSNITEIAKGPKAGVGTEVVVSADGGINIFAIDGSKHLQLLRIAPEDQKWTAYDVTTLTAGPMMSFPVGAASVNHRLTVVGRTDDLTKTLALFSLDTTARTWSLDNTGLPVEL